ncbi:hypothetical protein WI69_25500 [Burkholderia diffusa]|nr:hypothetical protein WI69_25500 [Burkholderia diffusa]
MRAAHEGCVVSDSVTLRRQIPGMNSHTRIPNAPATGSRAGRLGIRVARCRAPVRRQAGSKAQRNHLNFRAEAMEEAARSHGRRFDASTLPARAERVCDAEPAVLSAQFAACVA